MTITPFRDPALALMFTGLGKQPDPIPPWQWLEMSTENWQPWACLKFEMTRVNHLTPSLSGRAWETPVGPTGSLHFTCRCFHRSSWPVLFVPASDLFCYSLVEVNIGSRHAINHEWIRVIEFTDQESPSISVIIETSRGFCSCQTRCCCVSWNSASIISSRLFCGL